MQHKVQAEEQERNVNQLQKMMEDIFKTQLSQDQDQYLIPEKQLVLDLQKELEVKT